MRENQYMAKQIKREYVGRDNKGKIIDVNDDLYSSSERWYIDDGTSAYINRGWIPCDTAYGDPSCIPNGIDLSIPFQGWPKIVGVNWNPPGEDAQGDIDHEFIRIYYGGEGYQEEWASGVGYAARLGGWSVCTQSSSGNEYERFRFDCNTEAANANPWFNGCTYNTGVGSPQGQVREYFGGENAFYCMSPGTDIVITSNADFMLWDDDGPWKWFTDPPQHTQSYLNSHVMWKKIFSWRRHIEKTA